jgi:hypothetical protein
MIWCWTESWFIQVTVVPCDTVTDAGINAKFWIVIVVPPEREVVWLVVIVGVGVRIYGFCEAHPHPAARMIRMNPRITYNLIINFLRTSCIKVTPNKSIYALDCTHNDGRYLPNKKREENMCYPMIEGISNVYLLYCVWNTVFIENI